MQEDDFLKENGLIFSKIEELKGQVLLLKSRVKSQESEVSGLQYQNENYKNKIENLETLNRQLRVRVQHLEAGIEEHHNFIPQNFKIKNKLVKIVSDIEESGLIQEVNLKEYLNVLIEEIDICINQLSK